MAFLKLFYLTSALYVCTFVSCDDQPAHKKFEYKFSFKPPYLAQKDGSVPFWEYGGNAIASGESVRLAPSLRSQKGAIWSKQPLNFEWWEVDLMFKVTGRGRIGADGLAFWYTAERGEYGGEVFGSSDKWKGLAVMFDSFDNDNKHNNPYIMAVLNDGTKMFDHKSDGSTQLLSGCLRDFRNKPFPTRAKVQYYLNTLTVYFHNGMSNNEADYELCFRSENVVLPRGGFLGVSAATGGLADDHDVIHLLTTSLHHAASQETQQINNAEQQRLSDEYQQYQQKLQQQKDDYRKEHPNELKDEELDDWFESDTARETRQLLQAVSKIHEDMNILGKKIDELTGKQGSSLSLLSALYTAQQSGAGLPPGQVPPQGLPPAIGRPEIDAVLSNHQIIVNTIAELKGYIIELARKSDSANTLQLTNEVRDQLTQMRVQLGQASRPGAAQVTSCPDTGVSSTILLMFLAVHLFIMLLYSLYKERKEAQAKKFF